MTWLRQEEQERQAAGAAFLPSSVRGLAAQVKEQWEG